MATNSPPVTGVAFEFRTGLEDFANPGSLKSSPTLATGDAKVDIDGAGFNNLATLPSVSPAGTTAVKVALSAGEMTGTVITIALIDQTSPKEWSDKIVCIVTRAAAPVAIADLLAQALAALNTAVPGSPTANSINERIKALDDEYTAARAAKLDNLDVTVGSRLPTSSYTAPPSAAAIRIEMDANSTDLDAIGALATTAASNAADAETAALAAAAAAGAAEIAADAALAEATAVRADTEDLQSRTVAALVDGRVPVDVPDGHLTDPKFGSDMDTYQAKVGYSDDEANALDLYSVQWLKNGQPILAGVTDAEIRVFEDETGDELFALNPMIEAGSEHVFHYEEATDRMVPGAIYWAEVAATIDGTTRVWRQQIQRDSTA